MKNGVIGGLDRSCGFKWGHQGWLQCGAPEEQREAALWVSGSVRPEQTVGAKALVVHGVPGTVRAPVCLGVREAGDRVRGAVVRGQGWGQHAYRAQRGLFAFYSGSKGTTVRYWHWCGPGCQHR